MDTHQIERAAYIAAHAVLTANVSAPELACPGARRSYAVDTVADIIKRVFEVHSGDMDAFTDWWDRPIETRRPHLMPAPQAVRSEKFLQTCAETAPQTER
jgi:hypothetical protein